MLKLRKKRQNQELFRKIRGFKILFPKFQEKTRYIAY